jgi:hypothetical protein
MKMREKEAEMRSYFEVPRPKEIDFSDIPRDSRPVMRLKAHPDVRGNGNRINDDDDDGDSPLAADGDNMDKLIAERIAARQRDLDEIGERIKAAMPQPQQPQQHPAEYNPNDVMPHEDAGQMPTPPLALQTVDTRKVRFQEDTNPIFLKLKRKPMEDQGDF